MGFIQILRGFPSPPEGFPRTLRIHLPEAYFRDEGRRFGVLYMHDGQNVFAHPESARAETWNANGTMEMLVEAGAIAPWITVGIDHGIGRFEDYSPWPEPSRKVKPRAEIYASFLVDHLKPFIDQSFRTLPQRETTAVAGSSLGGLVTLFLARRHPQVFGRIGALSPSVMWANRQSFGAWKQRGPLPQKIYLDAGATEAFDFDGMRMEYGREVRAFAEQLRAVGYSERELRVVLEPGGQHSEVDWSRRLPDALAWLLD
jgi:predicted alpha/beta superfamily hydrolase